MKKITNIANIILEIKKNKITYNEVYFGTTKASPNNVFSKAIAKENESLDFTWDILNEMKNKIFELETAIGKINELVTELEKW